MAKLPKILYNYTKFVTSFQPSIMPSGKQNPEVTNPQGSAPELPAPFEILGTSIVFTRSGPAISVDKALMGAVIKLNPSRFPSLETAVRTASIKAVELAEMRAFVRENPRSAIAVLSSSKSYQQILKLQGLRRFAGEARPEDLQLITSAGTENLTLSQQFTFACEHFALTGEFPANLAPEVQQILDEIPASKRGLHRIDEIVSQEHSPESNIIFYKKIQAAFQKIRELEKQQTAKFEYKPQIGAGEQEPLDPESIETRVTPFYGGYYRGNVCYFDPDDQQIVQEVSGAFPFEPSAEPDSERFKIYTYETTFNPGSGAGAGANRLEMPYNAFPLISTLAPKNLQILRTKSGIFYLAPKALAPKVGSGKPPKTKVSFQFVIAKTADNILNDTPEGQPEAIGEPLDQETEEFIQQMSAQPFLSPKTFASRAAAFTRKKFKYPPDENSRNQMNQLYLQSGRAALQAICRHGITDCYWSNIFCGELLKRLGQNHRLIAGHYIQKDPRFEFAAVAGIGHAWGEIFNGEEWEKVDATPAKEKPEPPEEEPEEQDPQDGDFGESEPPEEQPEMTPEEISLLFRELINQTNQQKPPTNAEIFERENGVSLAEWQKVESFIKQVNGTSIPAETAIDGRAGTIEQEWDKLFQLIYKRREIPVEAYRGPVAQSEGSYLDDDVDAAIDLLAHEQDPMGWKLETEKRHEQIEITEFDDDAILDLTASMGGSPLEEQKKMLLSGLYNLMMINDRLGLDSHKNKMDLPVTLRSHVISFQGDTKVTVQKQLTDPIDKKALVGLYRQLDKTEGGGGNLLGSLQAYEAALEADQKTQQKLHRRKMIKVLTIVSDGGVPDQSQAMAIIARLRQKGVIVQGIGFGTAAQDIRVICHDPLDPEAGKVITDVRDAVPTRHKMLTRALKNL
jgi:hypothetical protein